MSDLAARLRTLHLNAGEPSTREIARRTGSVVSHSTVHQILSGRRVPRWGALELLVEALGGDAEDFLPMWKDLRVRARGETGNITEADQSRGSYRIELSTIESYGRDARDFITLEESRKIQSIDGPRASAEYIRSRIGRNWSSGLVGAYLALLENSGQQREIEDILPHLRGVCVRSPSAAHAVASIFDDREEYAEAARHEKEALRLDPNNPEYAWYVASYLDTLEAHDEAHRYYALAYSLDPGDVDRTESYIVSLLEHSDFSRAAQVALEFPSSDSKYAEVRSFAGVAFALQGEFSKAEDVLKSISGTSGRAVRALAQVMMAQGKVDDAADLLISRWQSHSESATALLCVEVLRQTGSLDAVEDVMAGLAEHLEREERRFAQFAARTVAGQQSSRSGDA